MSANADSLEQLDTFDHTFVDAVLQLRGIDEQPTFEQFKSALSVLTAYYSALMTTPVADDLSDEEWLDGHTIDSAAFQFAFLFSRYGLLHTSQATAEQLSAFNHWWRTGQPPHETTTEVAHASPVQTDDGVALLARPARAVH